MFADAAYGKDLDPASLTAVNEATVALLSAAAAKDFWTRLPRAPTKLTAARRNGVLVRLRLL